VALVGYARVSTAEQNLDLQRSALAEAGCEEVHEDHASGAKAERPVLARVYWDGRVPLMTARCAGEA
jgi:DNA invertase Pin-like site-specific DNA recombinase